MKSVMCRGIVMIVLISSGNCFGYVYHISVMKKIIDKKTNRCQMVIGLGDYHDKTHSANKSQSDYLDRLLKKCAAIQGKLIVEDLGSVNNAGRMICCNYGINACAGILGKLANKAREHGIAVDNVEYRYCRVAGIGPMLNNLHVSPHSLRSSAAIMTSSLHKEVVDEIEKIKKYDDGRFLNSAYKKMLFDVHHNLSKIAFNAYKNSTVADYCSRLQHNRYRQELERLCVFDSALIDMNIIHSVVSCPDAPYIFIIAGGSHIEQVSAMLKRVGYESIFATSPSQCPGIKKVVNADNADRSTGVLPEPVDLAIIDRFVH